MNEEYEEAKVVEFSFVRQVGLLAMAFLVVLVSFRDFSGVSEFGFTPEYIRVVQDMEEFGRYVHKIDENVVIDEVKREPLYPVMLSLAKHFLGTYESLIYVQFIAMVLAYYLWGRLAFKAFGWLTAICFFILLLTNPTLAFYSSILYPYSFQLLFLTLTLVFLYEGLRRGYISKFILAGVFIGLAIYERGAYLLLPGFLICGLFVFRKRFKFSLRHLLMFAAAAYLSVAPWLIRNMVLGTLGMNETLGLTLGWTYGQLESPKPLTEDAQRYDEFVSEYRTDAGTSRFIKDEVRSGRATFAEANRKVVSIVLPKMKNNIGSVAFIIMVQNFGIFPSRLCDPMSVYSFSRESTQDIDAYWLKNIRMKIPSACDFILFLMALFGIFLIWRKRTGFALISILFFSYTLFFSTTLAVSDPRYRGIVDVFLILLASCTLISGLTWVHSRVKLHRCKLTS